MNAKPTLPLDAHDALTQLFNAVFQDKELGEREQQLYESGAIASIELLCEQLPCGLRTAMVNAYRICHKYDQG